jgi:hypothetical protein
MTPLGITTIALAPAATFLIRGVVMSQSTKTRKTLEGRVDRIIKSYSRLGVEQAQISIEGGDDLYREIRIENRLTDYRGNEVRLREGAPVHVVIEVDEQHVEPPAPCT